jgi:hypothetical protein
MKLRKVYPKARISTKDGLPESEIRLLRDKYYNCPHCNKRTLIRSTAVSPMERSHFRKAKGTQVFDDTTQKAFDNLGTLMQFPVGADRILDAYDFLCHGCGRPVRFLYEEFERAMGSEISAVVYQVIERAD